MIGVLRVLGLLAAVALLAGCSSCPPPVILPPDQPPPVSQDRNSTPHPICTAAQLAITMGESDTGNTGTMNMHWVFINRGGECYTRGWPTVVFTDDQGRTVYTADRDNVGALSTYGGGLFAPTIRLRIGEQASVFWHAIEGKAQTCARSTRIRVSPPEADGWAYAPDGGYAGPGGWWCRAEVGVMAAGSSTGM